MANTKKSPAKKTTAKKKETLVNKEISNGAFILVIVVGMAIAGIIGWVVGANVGNLLK